MSLFPFNFLVDHLYKFSFMFKRLASVKCLEYLGSINLLTLMIKICIYPYENAL